MITLRTFLMPLALSAGLLFAGLASAVEIASREMTLAATERPVKVEFFAAPGTAKRGSVLMLHGGQGWGGAEGRADDFRHYARELAAHGFDAYMVYYYSDQDIADRKVAKKVEVLRDGKALIEAEVIDVQILPKLDDSEFAKPK